jgi:hypothetical protein
LEETTELKLKEKPVPFKYWLQILYQQDLPEELDFSTLIEVA